MKPWHRARSGESQQDRLTRISHSCYRCGHYERDLDVLADHEDACGARPNDDQRSDHIGNDTK